MESFLISFLSTMFSTGFKVTTREGSSSGRRVICRLVRYASISVRRPNTSIIVCAFSDKGELANWLVKEVSFSIAVLSSCFET
jgi:hypothetical protein